MRFFTQAEVKAKIVLPKKLFFSFTKAEHFTRKEFQRNFSVSDFSYS